MGKTGGNSWINAVKWALRSPVKETEKRRSRRRQENQVDEEDKKRGKRRSIFQKPFPLETTIKHDEAKIRISNTSADTKGGDSRAENYVPEQRYTIALALATSSDATEAEAPEILVQEQNSAAIVIQTIFRGYLARKALGALKGVVVLQALVRGHNVRTRAKMTLQCMQSLVQVQAHVCDLRKKLSCEGGLNSMETHLVLTGSNSIQSRHWCFSEDDSDAVEEIQALIGKAKECTLQSKNALAYFSQQMWPLDEHQFTGNKEELDKSPRYCDGKTANEVERTLCCPTDKIETILIDTVHPNSCSNANVKKFQDQNGCDHHSPNLSSPLKMNLASPLPNYMKATSSAKARACQQNAPNQTPSTPEMDEETLIFPSHGQRKPKRT